MTNQHALQNSNKDAFLQDNMWTWLETFLFCPPIIDNVIRLKILDARPFFSDTQAHISNIDLDSLLQKSVFDSNALWTNPHGVHRRYNHEDLENLHVLALSHHIIICECLMPKFKVVFIGAVVQHWKNTSSSRSIC